MCGHYLLIAASARAEFLSENNQANGLPQCSDILPNSSVLWHSMHMRTYGCTTLILIFNDFMTTASPAAAAAAAAAVAQQMPTL
jgi:hypothetical protein